MGITAVRWPSPAMVTALSAVVLSIGGTGYAVSQLPAQSVGSRELKANAVTASKIKARAVTARALAPNAVNGSKIAHNSLTGKDINEATLDIPAKTSSTPVANATHAESAAALDAVSYRSMPITLPPGGPNITGTVRCPGRQRIVGGGVQLDNLAVSNVVDSYPVGTTAWQIDAVNVDPDASHGATVYAICVPSVDAG
jgi:hypothetical protein